jgi:hypothetical protein
VDRDGNFVERPIDRYAKKDEWTFVTLAQFAGPITPSIVAPPDVAATLLDDSVECRHTYLTYREIDRPGPHPADFLKFGTENGMLAPHTLQDQLATQPPPPSPVIPGLNATSDAVNARVAAMTGTNAPSFTSAPPPPGPEADTRRVKYWITMSLPSYWTKPPADAKPEEIYLYRPDFYQDEDGIARRIALWFNPTKRTTLKELLGDKLPGAGATQGANPSADSPGPPSRNPFQTPLDDTYSPGVAPRTPNSSSKNPTPPSGLKTDNAPIPSPLINAAPANTNAAPATTLPVKVVPVTTPQTNAAPATPLPVAPVTVPQTNAAPATPPPNNTPWTVP